MRDTQVKIFNIIEIQNQNGESLRFYKPFVYDFYNEDSMEIFRKLIRNVPTFYTTNSKWPSSQSISKKSSRSRNVAELLIIFSIFDPVTS